MGRVLMCALCVVTLGCDGATGPSVDSDVIDGPWQPATFALRVGVETVTVTGAEPGTPLTLYDGDGRRLVTQVVDGLGQTHFAYVPDEHMVLDTANLEGLTLATGSVLAPGAGYVLRDDTESPVVATDPFTVLAVDDHPDVSLYEGQVLDGIVVSPVSGPLGDLEDGYQYITTRDGTSLSAMIRLPDPTIYGEGPHPTVIEYSGYAPSRPDQFGDAARIANALGYAVVSVNMRGTGCSGGVFDFFNRAQHADGYDVVETVARQPWVMNGKVGMVGLSYPGISQLYVASTNPPSLAAIVPLSTIADAWEMQWPGGIYNEGFTKQWVAEREARAEAGGANWVVARIAAGDAVCEENLRLSQHSIDFVPFLRALEMRPANADERDLHQLVEGIACPVFYGGAFQDEQTGAQFGGMLDRFYASAALRILLVNGRHPDGYAPHAVYRWFEFLEFYVAERIPVLNALVREFGAPVFGESFGMTNTSFEPDRFTDFEDFEAAVAAYEAEPPVRLLFESGAGADEVGTPTPRFEMSLATWPSDTSEPVDWFLGGEGRLEAEPPAAAGADRWGFDGDAGSETFFGPSGYHLLEPLWDIAWTPFAEGKMAAYVTDPFEEAMVLTGPGIAELWVRSPVDDLTVQVTLTEVRADGLETLVQSGWLRLGHRAASEGEGLRLGRSYSEDDYAAMPVDTWTSAKVAVPSFAHPMREGSALRMVVSSPGRDHGTWEFEPIVYADAPTFELGRGDGHPSSLTLGSLPAVDIPVTPPPCPSLRGQPCRTYQPVDNRNAD